MPINQSKKVNNFVNPQAAAVIEDYLSPERTANNKIIDNK